MRIPRENGQILILKNLAIAHVIFLPQKASGIKK